MEFALWTDVGKTYVRKEKKKKKKVEKEKQKRKTKKKSRKVQKKKPNSNVMKYPTTENECIWDGALKSIVCI